ncbi:MAG TPA: amino acid synthesis family protein, partial [Blastocatellia bacterium]|nr:amino acid synthesis family protein [Blastocatellia bacterium]
MDIRRILIIKDVVYAEGGLAALDPVTRVAACAVVANPLAGRAEEDLSVLVSLGAELGEQLVREALKALPRPAISYGKAAIVGVAGDIEHAAAILHPRMG